MKFLVDANVLSEVTKPKPLDSVVRWLEVNERDLVVNPIVLGELQYGILLLSAGKKRTELLKWFAAGVKHLLVLDIDANTASIWAKLIAALKRKGQSVSVKDSLIAATAVQHRLTVATRNVRDFERAGVRVENPFSD